MMRPDRALFWVFVAFCAGLMATQGGPARAADAPPDYSQAAAWICRPGQEGACTTGLDAMIVAADGKRTPENFTPAADPPIDCFYVYPTVSLEPGLFADMTLSPEIARVALSQAGRLTSRCRLFAPIYRQHTMAGLSHELGTGEKTDFSVPYGDVLAAWRWYMANANHGRGVVLIGHSQGTIVLQRLIAEEIDPAPAKAHLVAAFLAGDPSLPVPKGADVGGVFKHIPLCTAAAQIGCAYVWGSYLADDSSTDRMFGHDTPDGLVGGCANPASPGGGAGTLKAYLHRPMIAPESDPPWVAVQGQLSAQCVTDSEGSVLRISILPSRFADLLQHALHARHSGWGLHPLDVNLVQGNILDLLGAETTTWVRGQPIGK